MNERVLTLQRVVAIPRHDEKGATAVEYGLMVGLIAVAIIGSVTLFSDSLNTMYNMITASL
jgi:pilus assembly protein Flp/PilA